MTDKETIRQVIGSLMKHPQYLSEVDKYKLTPDDFSTIFERNIFSAIDGLYQSGAECIFPIDIENYLKNNGGAKANFDRNNGIEYLQDAEFLSNELTFPYYYKKLKKINLLNTINSQGPKASDFYNEDLTDPKAFDLNKNFESLEISDMLTSMKHKMLIIERKFTQNDTTETTSVFDGIEELIEEADDKVDVGLPIQGEIFNQVLAGARKGTLCIRSGGSGVSKTRQAVGDACYLAFPFRYDDTYQNWVQVGGNQKVLFIATEQNAKEIQKMILAYLTGFNETKFRYGNFTDEEKKILRQALWILEQYKDNFYIVRMPNPTIELIKTIVRENCLMRNIEYVFYDYVFIGPAILREFKGFNLRNDEILLMLTTALKDLAVELNIFVMTSTQVNANADNNENIRNESSLAGSRSIINKADVGAIMARPTKEELNVLEKMGTLTGGVVPNIVTDIYKVRSGELNQVRIWSDVNLGNLRKKDLFVTDSRLQILDSFNVSYVTEIDWEADEQELLTKQLIQLNEMK